MEDNILYLQSHIFEGPRYHIKGISWHDIKKKILHVLSIKISLFILFAHDRHLYEYTNTNWQ